MNSYERLKLFEERIKSLKKDKDRGNIKPDVLRLIESSLKINEILYEQELRCFKANADKYGESYHKFH